VGRRCLSAAPQRTPLRQAKQNTSMYDVYRWHAAGRRASLAHLCFTYALRAARRAKPHIYTAARRTTGAAPYSTAAQGSSRVDATINHLWRALGVSVGRRRAWHLKTGVNTICASAAAAYCLLPGTGHGVGWAAGGAARRCASHSLASCLPALQEGGTLRARAATLGAFRRRGVRTRWPAWRMARSTYCFRAAFGSSAAASFPAFLSTRHGAGRHHSMWLPAKQRPHPVANSTATASPLSFLYRVTSCCLLNENAARNETARFLCLGFLFSRCSSGSIFLFIASALSTIVLTHGEKAGVANRAAQAATATLLCPVCISALYRSSMPLLQQTRSNFIVTVGNNAGG